MHATPPDYFRIHQVVCVRSVTEFSEISGQVLKKGIICVLRIANKVKLLKRIYRHHIPLVNILHILIVEYCACVRFQTWILKGYKCWRNTIIISCHIQSHLLWGLWERGLIEMQTESWAGKPTRRYLIRMHRNETVWHQQLPGSYPDNQGYQTQVKLLSEWCVAVAGRE